MGYSILILVCCAFFIFIVYLLINDKFFGTYDKAKETVRKVAKDKFSSSMDPRKLYTIFFDQTYRSIDGKLPIIGSIPPSEREKETLCFMLFIFTHCPSDSWKNPHLTRGRFWQFCKSDHAKSFPGVSELYPKRESFYLSVLNGDSMPVFHSRYSSQLKIPDHDPLFYLVSAFFDFSYAQHSWLGGMIVNYHADVLRITRSSIQEFLEMEE